LKVVGRCRSNGRATYHNEVLSVAVDVQLHEASGAEEAVAAVGVAKAEANLASITADGNVGAEEHVDLLARAKPRAQVVTTGNPTLGAAISLAVGDKLNNK